MTIWVLALAFILNNKITSGVFTNGEPQPVFFRTKADCEKVREEHIKQMDTLLPKGAKLLSIRCTEVNAPNGV